MRLHVTQLVGVAALLLAAGLLFVLAADFDGRIDECRYARESGHYVLAQVYGRSIDTESGEGLTGPGQFLEGPCFVSLSFRSNSGFEFKGRTRVTRHTWEKFEYARASKPMLILVCVPPSRPDAWMIHQDAVHREAMYAENQRSAIVCALVFIGLAVLGLFGEPVINLVNRFLIRHIPFAYGVARPRLSRVH